MTAEEIAALADQLAPRVGAYILDSPAFRLMLKEAAMMQAAEQQRLRLEELPRAFVAYCATAGVHLRVKGGAVWLSKPLPPEMEKFRDLYHEEITRYLLREPIIHTDGGSP